jgi:RNA exonuclease NGL2
MSKRQFNLTHEQRALAEERKRKRAEAKKKQEEAPLYDSQRGRILSREWIDLRRDRPDDDWRRVRIKTWNVGPVLHFYRDSAS